MVLEIFIIYPSQFHQALLKNKRAIADMKVSVVALCNHDGIVRGGGGMDGDMFMDSLHGTHHFCKP